MRKSVLHRNCMNIQTASAPRTSNIHSRCGKAFAKIVNSLRSDSTVFAHSTSFVHEEVLRLVQIVWIVQTIPFRTEFRKRLLQSSQYRMKCGFRNRSFSFRWSSILHIQERLSVPAAQRLRAKHLPVCTAAIRRRWYCILPPYHTSSLFSTKQKRTCIHQCDKGEGRSNRLPSEKFRCHRS